MTLFFAAQMAESAPAPKYVPKIPGKGVDEDLAPIHKIRITLTSRNVKNLEKGAPRPDDQFTTAGWRAAFSRASLLTLRHWST